CLGYWHHWRHWGLTEHDQPGYSPAKGSTPIAQRWGSNRDRRLTWPFLSLCDWFQAGHKPLDRPAPDNHEPGRTSVPTARYPGSENRLRDQQSGLKFSSTPASDFERRHGV